jgi:hypothetical protein
MMKLTGAMVQVMVQQHHRIHLGLSGLICLAKPVGDNANLPRSSTSTRRPIPTAAGHARRRQGAAKK